MKVSHRVGSLAGVAMFLTATGVAAVPGSQSTRYDEEIVVSATNQPTPRNEVPIRSEVISAEEIAARQVVGVADVLAQVPGITTAQSGSPGKNTSVFVRGAESDHVLVLWNGIRLNDPFFGGFDWAHLTTEGLDRAEVIYGPQGLLHGSDALGGVVNLVTPRNQSTAVLVEGGNDGQSRVVVGGGRRGERSGLAGTVFWRQDDGAQDNDDYKIIGGHASGDWSLYDGSELGLLLRWTDHQLGIPRASGFPSPNRRQEGNSVQVALPWSWVGSEWIGSNWSGGAALQAHRSDLNFRDPDSFFSSSDTEAQRLRIRATTHRQGDKGSLSFGLEQTEDAADNASNFGVNLDGTDRSSSAAFVEMARMIGARTRVDVGARYDDDEFFGDNWTVRAAAQVQWTDRWATYGSYSEGFRAPSIGELFFPFFGSADLQPEVGDTVEAGVRRSGSNWTLEVARFESQFDNLIDSDPVTFLAVNRVQAEVDGWEGSWVMWGEKWAARAAWSNLDLATGDGRPLLRRPENSFSAGVTRYGERWTWNATARWVGDRPDLDPATFATVENPAYTLAGAALSRHFSWGALRFRGENLFDREYQQVLGFASPERRWVVGVEWR